MSETLSHAHKAAKILRRTAAAVAEAPEDAVVSFSLTPNTEGDYDGPFRLIVDTDPRNTAPEKTIVDGILTKLALLGVARAAEGAQITPGVIDASYAHARLTSFHSSTPLTRADFYYDELPRRPHRLTEDDIAALGNVAHALENTNSKGVDEIRVDLCTSPPTVHVVVSAAEGLEGLDAARLALEPLLPGNQSFSYPRDSITRYIEATGPLNRPSTPTPLNLNAIIHY